LRSAIVILLTQLHQDTTVSEIPPDDAEMTPQPPKTETAVELVLDDFSTLDTATMQIIPPGRGVAIGSITFAGPGHPKTRAQQQRDREKAEVEKRQQRLNPRYQPPELTGEQEEADAVRRVVDRIISWDIKGREKNLDTGEERIVQVPFTADAAMKLLLDPNKRWLCLDAIVFVNRVENFMPSSLPV
jgi:hypothetical protein